MAKILRMKDCVAISKVLKKANLKPLLKEDFKNSKQMIFTIILHIVENIDCMENEFNSMISLYKDIETKNIADTDMDEIIEILKEMFTDGIPKAIKDMFDLNDLKKKFTELKSSEEKNITNETI
jgi:CTP synthase (UTP-ammonia lyase)